ncbi:hypothetical protein M069_4623 [Bacteroides fragilis str. B1 (UDC16-1)]|nr:hypothetical protein M069_4623 [Bacteroides fragilis str. B1 (UDC16-1)]
MVHRDYFRKGVIILCHDVIHLILIICVQQAIGCKVLWALQHDCPPFNPQEITFVQSHSERGLIFNLSFAIAFQVIFDGTAFEEVRTPFRSKVCFRPSLRCIAFIDSERMRETLGTPNNRVVILCKLRKAQRGVIVVYIRDSERHQIERCRELGVKVHKRSEVCLFHLELGFFGQRFRLWIGLPFVLKGSRQTDNCTCCSLSIICRDCNLLVCIRGFRNLTGKMNLQLIGFYLERCPSTIVCVRTARNRIEHIEILASHHDISLITVCLETFFRYPTYGATFILYTFRCQNLIRPEHRSTG